MFANSKEDAVRGMCCSDSAEKCTELHDLLREYLGKQPPVSKRIIQYLSQKNRF
jgi:hypothetical protein